VSYLIKITLLDVLILSSGSVLLKLVCCCITIQVPLACVSKPKICVTNESYYDIHEDEQNGYVTERKNREVCWRRRYDSWRGMLNGSTHGTSFSSHTVVKETEYPDYSIIC